jgi:hypothetical protein
MLRGSRALVPARLIVAADNENSVEECISVLFCPMQRVIALERLGPLYEEIGGAPYVYSSTLGPSEFPLRSLWGVIRVVLCDCLLTPVPPRRPLLRRRFRFPFRMR